MWTGPARGSVGRVCLNTPSGTLLPLVGRVDYALVLQQPRSAAIFCGAACFESRGTPCARQSADPQSPQIARARKVLVANGGARPSRRRCNTS
jgi:hypothetical protein